jgi:hypothetical protein
MSKPVLPPGTSSDGGSSREPVTPVVFRKWPKSEGGGVIALFPDEEERSGMIGSYESMGGHGAASRGLVFSTKAAKPDEYASLKRELESAPYNYNLRVLSRVRRSR